MAKPPRTMMAIIHMLYFMLSFLEYVYNSWCCASRVLSDSPSDDSSSMFPPHLQDVATGADEMSLLIWTFDENSLEK
jgi:hypothetical protein